MRSSINPSIRPGISRRARLLLPKVKDWIDGGKNDSMERWCSRYLRDHTDDEAEKDPHAIHWTSLKRCTLRAMILSNGAVDTHRKESLHSGNTYPLQFL